jgi:hypothetical protein
MSWHEGEKITVVTGIIFASLLLCLYICLVFMTWNFNTLTDFKGRPLALDFANFWAASKLALSGKAALAYNVNKLHEVQLLTLGTQHSFECGWHYPPPFFLAVLPLGLLPYLPSLFIWMIVTLLLYLIILYRLSPHPILIILCVLFPGIYQNFIVGQNGYLSGILFGGALLLLDRRPLTAGCLIGFLCYKPPLVIITFIALIFGRYWKPLISAIVTYLVLVLASIMVLGYQVWIDYFKVMAIPMKLMEIGVTNWSIMPTFFAATMSAGFSVKIAYIVQAMGMLAVVSGVVWVWGKKPNTSIATRGAVLVLGTLLFPPYEFNYDLAILALPLCWLWEEGRINGRLPGELILLFFGWILPFVMPFIWNMTNIFNGKLQIGPAVLSALFILALMKWKKGMNRELQYQEIPNLRYSEMVTSSVRSKL